MRQLRGPTWGDAFLRWCRCLGSATPSPGHCCGGLPSAPALLGCSQLRAEHLRPRAASCQTRRASGVGGYQPRHLLVKAAAKWTRRSIAGNWKLGMRKGHPCVIRGGPILSYSRNTGHFGTKQPAEPKLARRRCCRDFEQHNPSADAQRASVSPCNQPTGRL